VFTGPIVQQRADNVRPYNNPINQRRNNMPSNQTPNYGLSQWSKSDRVQMADFNADNAKIDAAIKAESDARTALAAQVAGKASQSALNTLADKAAKCGNCQIYVTSYTGNGKYGLENARSMTFPKPPQMVLLSTTNAYPFAVLARGVTSSPPNNYTKTTTVNVIWNGNSITWYSGHDAPSGFNAENTLYYMLVLLAADQ
jgi:hypothetical protein